MIKVLMAGLAVLVMASVAYAAYPADDPCLVTQKLDPRTGVVTSVVPDQRVASAAGGAAPVASDLKVVPFAGGVTSIDSVSCPASYFGAQDGNRRSAPESGSGGGDSGAAGGAAE